MGYSYDDKTADDKSNIYTGDVVYRKKHIRLHNRILKMKQHKSKHTYFDDTGAEIKEADQVRFLSKKFCKVQILSNEIPRKIYTDTGKNSKKKRENKFAPENKSKEAGCPKEKL